jgi:hypothetical protein
MIVGNINYYHALKGMDYKIYGEIIKPFRAFHVGVGAACRPESLRRQASCREQQLFVAGSDSYRRGSGN